MTIHEAHSIGQNAAAFLAIAMAVTFVWQWIRDPR